MEQRCIRRSRAELREIAALAKPSGAQVKWFKDRMDAGVKTGPELHGQLDEKNWLRRFITNESIYLDQFPAACRKVQTDWNDWGWRTCKQMYQEEMVVCASCLCMNNTCKANLGQQVNLLTRTTTRFVNVVILQNTEMVHPTID